MTSNIDILKYMDEYAKEELNFDLVTLLFNEFKDLIPESEINKAMNKFGDYLNKNLDSIISKNVVELVEGRLKTAEAMCKDGNLESYINARIDSATKDIWSDSNIESILDRKIRNYLDKNAYSITSKIDTVIERDLNKTVESELEKMVEDFMLSRKHLGVTLISKTKD